MKNIAFLVGLGALTLLSMVQPSTKTYAQSCQGTTCNDITLVKTVLDPQKDTYVTALGLSDSHYHPGDSIVFHLKLVNKSKIAIPQIVVKDVFPQYVTFTSGAGSFDTSTNTLSFLVFNLKPNQSQEFAVMGTIVAVTKLPSNQSLSCIGNKALASLSSSQTMQATAQFCIEKVFPSAKVQTTPSTGPESLPLFSLLGTIVAGLYTIKRAKQSMLRA